MTRDTAVDFACIILAAVLACGVLGAAPYVDQWLVTGQFSWCP